MPKNKKSHGSVRSKAGLPAKAGRRRPPHIKSTIGPNGKREWVASNSKEAHENRKIHHEALKKKAS